ncbi:hypothetical protein ACH4UT_23425 [Streptomyces sp. NPDC020799]|uniref:hypothetical protein n=1 Tax=Streptomyces sp. NPDC020799 TaxID=3365091 RepID=UPI00346F0801
MIDRAPVTEAFRLMLTQATGKPCGIGALPLLGGKPAPLPYFVLYPLGGSTDGAPLADQSEDAALDYQVTAVAGRTDQAEWLGDRARRAVLERRATGEWSHPIKVPAGDIWARELVSDDGVDRPETSQGVVTYPLRFRFQVTG